MSKVLALIGNPNCGKTTLFNKLTGSRQKVGNWPGVTVDKKTGYYSFNEQTYEVVDLPGTYSSSVVSNASIDEKIACEFLLENQADIIINIVDAANLKRNLYLTSQLLEMNIPCIVAVNMLDIARARHLQIDLAKLAAKLNCVVVPLISSQNEGVNELKQAIEAFEYKPPSKVVYDDRVESSVESLCRQMTEKALPIKAELQRFVAIRLLERDALILEQDFATVLEPEAKNIIKEVEAATDEEIDILIADNRYQFANEVVQEVVVRSSAKQRTATERIDNIVTHKWLGIPIFLFLMYLMFELSMNIGTLLQPLFDISSTTIFINGIAYLGHTLGIPAWLTAIFSQGIGLGINTVVNFIPQIGLMFLFLSLLEDSGYMSRAAFVMDRFMQFAGLPGKSFVPLIVGFGCNVPSIMATRTLDSKRDRILTCMMSPFMSCGARLAIFIVFAGAFFPEHGGLVVFLLYVIGIVVAMLTGIFLKKSILKGDASPFVLELPVYHVPYFKSILLLTWNRLKGFLFRAGKVIVPVCVLVGSLNAIQINGQVVPSGSQNSVLSHIGKTITPVLEPMGVNQNNWPATVGLITGTLAKEVVVGTLNTLYTQNNNSVEDAYKHFHLWQGLKASVTSTISGFSQVFSSNMINPFTANEADHDMSKTAMGNMAKAFLSPIAAFAYLLFVLLYVPCVSTIGVLTREVGKFWAWASTLWSFNIAYALAVIFYQASIFMLQPWVSTFWIAGLLLLQGLLFMIARYYSFQKQPYQRVIYADT